MKDEGKSSKAPLTEAFAHWSNAKIVLIALIGGVMGQGVVWYTGQFYALFFLQSILKVDGYTANLLIAWSLLFGTGFFIVFGWLSRQDRPQADHPGGLPDRGADLLPDLQDDHEQRQPGAGKGHRSREGRGRRRQGRLAAICSTRSAPASSPRRAIPPAPSWPSHRSSIRPYTAPAGSGVKVVVNGKEVPYADAKAGNPAVRGGGCRRRAIRRPATPRS